MALYPSNGGTGGWSQAKQWDWSQIGYLERVLNFHTLAEKCRIMLLDQRYKQRGLKGYAWECSRGHTYTARNQT